MKEQISQTSTVMKASSILPMLRDDEVGQHVGSTNITGQQTPKKEIIFVCGINGMGSDMHTINEDIQIYI